MNQALHAMRTLFSRKAIHARGRTREAIYTRLAGGESLERRAMLAADSLSPWHNAALPMDVNGDQNVTALDALNVINRLNSGVRGPVTQVMPISRANFMAAAGDSRSLYVDVNNDGDLTSLDALTIINRLNAAAGETVRIRVDVTDSSGNPINTQSLSVGETFQLRGFVQDLRAPVQGEQRGLAIVFTDVNFDPSKVAVDGQITYSTTYDETNSPQSSITATPGLLNEIGGARLQDPIPVDATERQVFTVPFRVIAGGSLAFTLDAADINEVVFAGMDVEVPPDQILFEGDTVNLGTPPTANDDTETANEDAVTDFVVLDNDVPHSPGTGPLSIVAFGNVRPGATVEIINAGLGIRYRSAPNFNGVDTFTYTIRDANDEEDTATVTVNVANVNDPPDANNDVFTIDVNAPLQVLDVLVNDNNQPDPPGEALTIFGVTLVGPPNSGAVEVLNDGTRIGFTPTPGFVGQVTITYRLRDPGNAESEPATVVINVRDDNPTANPDTATVAEGSTANVIDVLANDELFAGTTGPLMVIDVSTGSQQGTLSIGAGGLDVRYTPRPNFFGTETFSYRVADGDGGEATGTVTVTVTDVPDPALAVADTATVAEDSAATAIPVLTNDNQQNPDAPETYTIEDVSQPTNGVVVTTGNGTGLTYRPNANFFGTDTFTYTIEDDDGTSSTATVTVTVTAVNDNPVAVDDVVDGVLEDQTTPVEIAVLVNDTTIETGETLTIQSFVAPPASTGTVVRSTDMTKLLFTPGPNFDGQAVFTYIVSDGNGGTDEGTVTVNVTPVADPPVAVDDTVTVAEDAVPFEIFVLTNDSPGDGGLANLIISAVAQPERGGMVARTSDNKRLLFTPAANFAGQATFNYTISNGQQTDTGTVTVVVTAVGDPPVAIADTFTIAEDAVMVFEILANDFLQNPDVGEALKISAVGLKGPPTQPGRTARGGSVEIIDNGARVRYTPPANNIAQDRFEYIVEDAGQNTAEGVVTINFNAIDDPPLAVTDTAEAEVDSELADNIIDVLANDIAQNPDPDDPLTLVDAKDFSNNGTFTIVDNKIRYKPAPGFVGTETFTYVVRDSTILESEGTVTVQVGNLADDDTLTFAEDQTPQPLELNVTANDRQGATVLIDSIGDLDAAEGTATISTDKKKILFTPAPNRSGAVTFTYTLKDGAETDTATVTVNLTPVNDPPANGQSTFDQFTINEDQVREITVDELLANDRTANPDSGETLTIVDAGIDAAGEDGKTSRGGTVELLPNGNLRYTPPANNFITDGFRYKVSDGTNTALVDVTIRFTEVNDPPTAGTDNVSVAQGGVITIDVLANDSIAPDQDTAQFKDSPITITALSNVVGGEATLVTVDGRQQVRFTAAPSFIGAASFKYTLRDSRTPTAGESQGTVNITVTPFAISSLSGKVYTDADNNGVQAAGEAGIANVVVRLSGKDMFGTEVSLTAVTDANGAYNFSTVVPGSYVIREVQPTGMIDGRETVGLAGGTAGLDEFFLTLGSGQAGTGYNFGERGLTPSIIGRHLFFEP